MRTFEETIEDIISCRIVEDLGQFGKRDLRLLNKAVKGGLISKGKGGEYPAIKTVFAPKGFDFNKHRSAVINLANDAQNGKISGMEYILYKFDYSTFIKN